MSEIERSDTSFVLSLVVNKPGVGGVPGLAPTVALRDGSTVDSYLDFNDDTFKTAGWGTKYAAMAEVERGHYRRTLDVSALSVALGTKLVAEYRADDSGDVGDSEDVFVVTNKLPTLEFLRKVARNRQVETSGNPGKLKVYDDDDSTLLIEYDLLDEAGGAIIPTVGMPARRLKGTP